MGNLQDLKQDLRQILDLFLPELVLNRLLDNFEASDEEVQMIFERMESILKSFESQNTQPDKEEFAQMARLSDVLKNRDSMFAARASLGGIATGPALGGFLCGCGVGHSRKDNNDGESPARLPEAFADDTIDAIQRALSSVNNTTIDEIVEEIAVHQDRFTAKIKQVLSHPEAVKLYGDPDVSFNRYVQNVVPRINELIDNLPVDESIKQRYREASAI